MELNFGSLKFIGDSATDVLPIVIFLFVFQRLVIGAPMPNIKNIAIGLVFVVIGLGLFLVYYATKSLNGQVSFESEPGKYTRFHVEIPKIRV